MRILFIHAGTESLGIEYLSSALKKEGYDVCLFYEPMIFRSFRMHMPLFYRDRISYIAKESVDMCPDLIGFSTESDYYGWAIGVARQIKKIANIPIIFGGIHPSSVPEIVIRESAVDYVCIGEGEKTIVELANCLSCNKGVDKILGIWYKRDGEIVRNKLRDLNQNLDDLSFPDKDLFYEKFPGFVNSVYTIVTGRGCCNNCTYCYNSVLRKMFSGRGKYLRRRSVKNVIEELSYSKEKYDYNRVTFCDDIFTVDANWMREFIELYKDKINLPFYCAAHPSFIDKEKVRLLVDGGCAVINLGIQTIDENTRRDFLHRFGSNEDVVNAIEMLKQTKIFLFTNFIFGLPNQEINELKRIVLFCISHKTDFHDVNWLRYYPKTEILNIAEAKGIITQEFVENINASTEFSPYAHGGHGFTAERSKLRNLIFISHFLPAAITRSLLSLGVYRFLPSFNLRNPTVILRLLQKKYFFCKKNPYPNFSLKDIFSYYLHFTIFAQLRK